MKQIITIIFTVLFLALTVSSQTSAPAGPISQQQLTQAEIDKIITVFTTNETKYREKLNSYAFVRDAFIQECPCGPRTRDHSELDRGRYHRVSKFSFDNSAKRYEKITYFPPPTDTIAPRITTEDIEDLGGVNHFALEPSKIAQYNIIYAGKERIDELDLYVFDVSPKTMPDPKKIKERLFLGRVWVEDQGYQIVKTRGKGVPETKNNKFPVVETYREQIPSEDGKYFYWFPTLSFADEVLEFENGSRLHIRMEIKFNDYKEYKGKVIIKEVDVP